MREIIISLQDKDSKKKISTTTSLDSINFLYDCFEVNILTQILEQLNEELNKELNQSIELLLK
jgi:hypothetical protein